MNNYKGMTKRHVEMQSEIELDVMRCKISENDYDLHGCYGRSCISWREVDNRKAYRAKRDKMEGLL